MTNPQDRPEPTPAEQPHQEQRPYQGQAYPPPGHHPGQGAPPPYPGTPQPYPGQPYPGQPYPGQPYPGQGPYPAQPYPGQQYPGQQYPQLQQGYGYPGAPGQSWQSDPTDVVGTRCWQHILDGLVLLALFVVAAIVVGLLSIVLDSAVVVALAIVAYGLVLVASWASQAWWPTTHNGQTPAMQWTKLRIVSEQGGQPTMGALTIRWLLLMIEGGVLGLILMLCTARHQRLGDMAAKTLVVRA